MMLSKPHYALRELTWPVLFDFPQKCIHELHKVSHHQVLQFLSCMISSEKVVPVIPNRSIWEGKVLKNHDKPANQFPLEWPSLGEPYV